MQNASFDWISLRFHLVVVTVIVTELDLCFRFMKIYDNCTIWIWLEFSFVCSEKCSISCKQHSRDWPNQNLLNSCCRASVSKRVCSKLFIGMDHQFHQIGIFISFVWIANPPPGRRLVLQPSVSSSLKKSANSLPHRHPSLKNRPTISCPKNSENQIGLNNQCLAAAILTLFTPLTEQSLDFKLDSPLSSFVLPNTYRNTPTLTLIHKKKSPFYLNEVTANQIVRR